MRVCVFCGSCSGGDNYLAAARQVGRILAERGVELVYGGASVGMMGAVADGTLAAGGTVIGVLPRELLEWEVGHQGLTEMCLVDGMHERKALMADLSHAFIALPGGTGTLEELFEVWTWAQLRQHAKPIGPLDVNGYFQHLTRFVDHSIAEGFLRPAYREMLLVDTDPGRLLDRFADYQPPDYQ
jgi:uncharacterized protein (TIGR00730 family)